MAEENDPKKEDPPRESWFLQLQRESWYLEMIISGVALFFVFQVPDALNQARSSLAYSFSGIIAILGVGLFTFLKTGSYFAIVSLILHLILRAFWIGVIGLNSVLPEGIVHERLHYSPLFKKKLQKKLTDPRHWAEKIDNVCSSIYGLTFFVLFLIIGLVLYVLTGIASMFLVEELLSQIEGLGSYWGIVLLLGYTFLYLLMGAMTFIDFITLGGLKRGRVSSKIYYVPYRIVSTVTLSFLIRPFYYLLITHISRVKGIIYACSLVLLIFFASHYIYIKNPYFPQEREFSGIMIHGEQLSEFFKAPGSYKNLISSRKPESAMIDRDIYGKDAGYLRLYIDLYGGMFQNIKRFCQEKGYEIPLERGWRRKFFVMDREGFSIPGANLPIDTFQGSWKCLNERYRVLVNDSTREVDFFFTNHPGPKDQKLVAHVPIRSLRHGRHELVVKKRYVGRNEEGERTIEESVHTKIPFWKE